MQLKGEVIAKNVEDYQAIVDGKKQTNQRGTVTVRCAVEDNNGAQTAFSLSLDLASAGNLTEFAVGQKVTLTIATS